MPWLEQCQVCGGWFPVEELVRQTQIRRLLAGGNYIAWSRYNTDGWSLDGPAYQGDISMGRSTFYWQNSGDDFTPAGGCATFIGDGRLLCSTQIDCSGWTRLLLQARFGHHQACQTPGLTITLGVLKGATEYEIGQRTEKAGLVWGAIEMTEIAEADRDALQPYFDVVSENGTEKWWAEFFQVQKDEQTPGVVFIPTRGAATVYSSDQRRLGKTVVCRKHWERLPKQIDEYRSSPINANVVPRDDGQEL